MKKSVSNLFYAFKNRSNFYIQSTDPKPLSSTNSSTKYHLPNTIYSDAFTIVELLVVIVVIGILAAVTIVSYGGVTNKATVASLQSDLTNTSQQLKLFQIDNSSYPATISTNCATNPDSLTNKCLKASEGTSYEYYVDNTTSNQTFCITATKGSYSYSINNNGTTIPTAYCPVLYLDAGNSLSYPGAGNNKWYDLSGNNNNGTINGGATYSAANGGAMGFDGVDDWITLPNDIVTTLRIRSSGVTYSAWVKSTNTTLEQRIIGQKPSSGYSDFSSGGLGISANKAKTIAYDDNVAYKYAIGNTTLQNNTWYFIVGTYDASDKNIRIFVNGLLDGSIVSIATFSRLLVNAENIVGTLNTASTHNLNGSISNICIYNRLLTSSEILQNFNTLRSRYGL